MDHSAAATELLHSLCIWDAAGNCQNPFCDVSHPYPAPTLVDGDYDPDSDWEGPQAPEYSEYDAEAFDEMAQDDLLGRW